MTHGATAISVTVQRRSTIQWRRAEDARGAAGPGASAEGDRPRPGRENRHL